MYSMSSGVGHDVSPDTTLEDDPEPYPYCGLTKVQPKPCFNPYRDVLLGDFVLCWPYDRHRFHVWLGRAISIVESSADSNYGTFIVEWWTPMCSKKKPKSLVAKECWTRRWTLEVTHTQRISVTIVFYSHKCRYTRTKGPQRCV